MTAALRTLVIDTATAACSVALFDGETLLDARHEIVGRGHAERLVPMIAELPGSGRADAILVDVGPGSFTGLRVGIAAAIGLGIGWGVPVAGLSSLPLIAAGAARAHTHLAELAVVIEGGHGEVFMQQFATSPLAAIDAPVSRRPDAALAEAAGRMVVGNAARLLGEGTAMIEALPNAADAFALPPAMRTIAPRPLYLRAPDAKLPGGGVPQ